MDSEKKDVEKAVEAAEQATQAAEQAAQAAEAVAVLEVIEQVERADDAGDRGRVYDDQGQLAAQVAATNAGLGQLDMRLLRVEAILRSQGYKL